LVDLPVGAQCKTTDQQGLHTVGAQFGTYLGRMAARNESPRHFNEEIANVSAIRTVRGRLLHYTCNTMAYQNGRDAISCGQQNMVDFTTGRISSVNQC
jgi:hypothetical protein